MSTRAAMPRNLTFGSITPIALSSSAILASQEQEVKTTWRPAAPTAVMCPGL